MTKLLKDITEEKHEQALCTSVNNAEDDDSNLSTSAKHFVMEGAIVGVRGLGRGLAFVEVDIAGSALILEVIFKRKYFDVSIATSPFPFPIQDFLRIGDTASFQVRLGGTRTAAY